MNYLSPVGTNNIDLKKLQEAAVGGSSRRLPGDAAYPRLTTSTFPAHAGIIDWVKRGELAKAVDGWNSGGTKNPHDGSFVSKDFYLQRLFDVMESLGRKQFEEYLPGYWDSILRVYRQTFGDKLVQESSPADTGVAQALYGQGP